MAGFDYENAERDISDMGADPDYLSHYDPVKRDKYMKELGMDPRKYGSTLSSDSSSISGGSSSSGDGCFVTSACVEARGLPDDCEELQILRHYRDTYLKGRDGGQEDIQTYYEVAPSVVARINEKENAKEIWNRVYEEMVLPCVRMIREGAMEDAYTLYRSYTMKLAGE